MLKELNSLQEKRPLLEKEISTELARIAKIEKQRNLRSVQLELDLKTQKELNSKITEYEKQVFTHSQNLSKAEAAKASVFTEAEITALTEQIEYAKKKTSEQEDLALEAIEEVEAIEQSIADAKTFLNGSAQTILEIEAEIKQQNEPIYNEIKTITSRIENLLENLPERVVQKLNYLAKKGSSFKTISEISSKNTCDTCGYLIPMALITAIETHQKFHTCPNCERILIPQSTKYL